MKRSRDWLRILGDKNFLMLRNHGLLTVAENIPEAFLALYIFESTCAIQVRAQGWVEKLIRGRPADHRRRAGQAKAGHPRRRRHAGVAGPAA